MSLPRKGFACMICAAFFALSVAFGQQQNEEEESIATLSPFSIVADEDEGYYASSSLSGTRLRTPLGDIGASVTAVTKEFLEDTGVDNIADLMTYLVGGEGGGLGGNFAGGGEISEQVINEGGSQRRPQNATRVRGLINADLSRGFFQTDIPMAGYNIDRVDISRGPNAVLFGLGSPAGLADYSLIKARVGENSTTLQTRFGRHGSYNASFDHNQVIVQDRFAVRIAGLHDNTKYSQKPAQQKDERIFLTARGNLFISDTANTTISANYERGKIEAHRPRLQAPPDFFSMWIIAGKPVWDASIGVGTQGNFAPIFPTAAIFDDIRPSLDLNLLDEARNLYRNPNIFWNISPVFDFDSQSPTGGFQVRRPPPANTPGVPGNPPRLEFFAPRDRAFFSSQLRTEALPTEVFDFQRRLLSGRTNQTTTDFDAFNIAIEQNFFRNRLGFELSYDKQNYTDSFVAPFGGARGSNVHVDINSHLTDGRVNPNFGRPFMTADNSLPRTGETDRESWRLTAYGAFDFNDHFDGWAGKLFGRHTLTAVFGRQDFFNEDISRQIGLIGENAAFDLNENNVVGQRRQVRSFVYIGDSVANINSVNDVRLDFNITARLPQPGDTLNMYHWDRVAGTFREGAFQTIAGVSSAFQQAEKIRNSAAVLQSYWLDERIITTVGWRKDTTDPAATTTFPTFSSGDLQGSIDLSQLVVEPLDRISGEIWTYSVVAKQPRNWKLPLDANFSVHYSESENFQPIAGQVDIFGREIAPPTGETEEYGFSVALLSNKIFLRVNRFTTDIANSRDGAGVGGGDFGSILNTDFQTLQFWYESVNSGGTLVGLSDIQALENSIPQGTRDLVQYRVVTGPDGTLSPEFNYPLNIMADVTNFRSQGWEYELTANVTRNWRLAANVAKIEAFRSSTAPFLAQFDQARIPTWRNSALSSLVRNPGSLTPEDIAPGGPSEGAETLDRTSLRTASSRVAGIQANDGTSSLNLRKWRFNLITNYTFDAESRFNGFSVGGAVRWQDKMVVSYPTFMDADDILRPDLTKPFFGDTETRFDGWIGYKSRWQDRFDWKVQLNVRNIFADGEVIPVTVNNDGSPAGFRASAPREIFVTTTISF